MSSCLDSSSERKFHDTFSLKKQPNLNHLGPKIQIVEFSDVYLLISTSHLQFTPKVKGADKFVCIVLDETVVGDIDFFFESDNSKWLCLKIFSIIRRLKLVNHQQNTLSVFGYIAGETEKYIRVPVSSITSKLIPVVFPEDLHLVKLMNILNMNNEC